MDLTLDEAIQHCKEVAEENEKVVNTRTFEDGHTVDEMYCDDTECIDAHLSRCAKCAKEHRQLSEWLKDYKRLLEQEPCEDEYIKVPKKALKYRTAGMVAYNAEWLKNHFDIERAVICGEQQPCEDAISRQAVIDVIERWLECSGYNEAERHIMRAVQSVLYDSLSVNSQEPKTGHCKDCKWWRDSDGVYRRGIGAESQCPINRIEVMEGRGYCYMYEPKMQTESEE